MKFILLAATLLASLDNCDNEPTTDQKQAVEQARALEEAHAQVGMPAITHFQEKRMAKDIYEMRDTQVATHAYIVNEFSGCLIYLGPAVGFGLPYATEYSSPTRDRYYGQASYGQVPQAEPNGLFMPASADGTWVLLKDPNSDATKPVYIEPRVIVSPFRLIDNECKPAAPAAGGKK